TSTRRNPAHRRRAARRSASSPNRSAMSLTGMKKHIRLLEGGGAGRDGEDRPSAQVHVSSLRLRGHKHVAAAARPLRPGRRTDERSTMSATAKKRKQQKNQGFTAEEKAAMRARARE